MDLAHKRFSAITTFLLLLPVQANGYNRFLSPNGQIEAYTTANYADGSGMKLFVRRADGHRGVVLLFSNQRWIDAKWSPDSRFLAVINHADGHVSDVYVFGIVPDNGRHLRAVLYYHTPKPLTYDVRWDVAGWRPRERGIVLIKEVRDQETRTITRTQVAAQIGTKRLTTDHSTPR